MSCYPSRSNVPISPLLPSQTRPECTVVWMGEDDRNFQDKTIPQTTKPTLLHFVLDRVLSYSPKITNYYCVPTNVPGCDTRPQETIVVEAAREVIRFQLDDAHAPLSEEIYNVSISMDIVDLKIDKIDNISFCFSSDDHDGAPEAFTSDELEALSKEGKLMLVLHRQLININKYRYLEMKIQTRSSLNSETDTIKDVAKDAEKNAEKDAEKNAEKDAEKDAGTIKLKSMTLQPTPFHTPPNVNYVHPPRLVSIDVIHRQILTDAASPLQPARIVHYSASGDGNYVATLSARDSVLHLDIWNPWQEGVAITNSNDHRKISMDSPISFGKSM
ncbi:MAG: hypothetical protein J3Q66DRAFT_6510 [Benniella sp.]|nr:MAG: hypothetical protein J3Q66DRAFT_6510 [Benniella sp.]